jgi:hypothetical protein
MSREIKFRVWSKEPKKMNPGFDMHDVFRLHTEPRNPPVYPYENYVLMQCTGLKDKNGKEIYEGDRIMIHAVDFSHSFPETIDDIFKAHRLCGESTTHWEVIGNIYENPELLT